MQTWTPEMWQAALIGLVVGIIGGYLIIRFTKDSVKKQVKTEADLQLAQAEIDKQKQQLEKHFSESAELLKTLAQDYQKLYRHLAATSNQLLPELAEKALFTQHLISDESKTVATADITAQEQTKAETGQTETDANVTDNAKTEVGTTEKGDNPPRDYSEGSSGILKAER